MSSLLPPAMYTLGFPHSSDTCNNKCNKFSEQLAPFLLGRKSSLRDRAYSFHGVLVMLRVVSLGADQGPHHPWSLGSSQDRVNSTNNTRAKRQMSSSPSVPQILEAVRTTCSQLISKVVVPSAPLWNNRRAPVTKRGTWLHVYFYLLQSSKGQESPSPSTAKQYSGSSVGRRLQT